MHTKSVREVQLIALAGFIGGTITLAQLNIQDVLRIDRLQHLTLSGLIFAFLYFILQGTPRRLPIAIGLTFLVGLLKEMRDYSFDFFDMAANFSGITLGILFVIAASLHVQARYFIKKRIP